MMEAFALGVLASIGRLSKEYLAAQAMGSDLALTLDATRKWTPPIRGRFYKSSRFYKRRQQRRNRRHERDACEARPACDG